MVNLYNLLFITLALPICFSIVFNLLLILYNYYLSLKVGLFTDLFIIFYIMIFYYDLFNMYMLSHSTVLNMCGIFVIVLMTLSANSITCVFFVSLSIDLFCTFLSCKLSKLLQDARFLYFTVLGVGYFVITRNIPEIYVGMQLSYLETVLVFLLLLLSFDKWFLCQG